ncbi:MAG TPA: isoprenylcysteine carboxylmethyltransferase family protein [Gaiellaceae bacterium]|nr:isoprenylcysteine carboxylmethyltransferase family protein [Gaiellaceae bacterium]
MLLVTDHAAARAAVFGLIGAGYLAEIVATYHGRGWEAFRPRRSSGLDRGTKQVVVLAMVAGILASVFIARSAALRTGANTWATYGLGMAVFATGIGFRVWAVWTLGRWFKREVTIDVGQTVQRGGPYRFVRHPAYLGDVLIAFGFGLAWGSWLGAAVALTLTVAGHLPRIRVEEAALRDSLGEEYVSYANGRARFLPGVW